MYYPVCDSATYGSVYRRTSQSVGKMEPCIEIDPSKYVIVVGPQFTVSVMKELSASESADECNSGAPILAFSGIVEEGIKLLLETEQFQNESERVKFETLYRNAYELEPLFALRKIAASLKKTGRYSEWLNRVFEWKPLSNTHVQSSHSLQHLLQLQRNGALLVYTHCDDILDRAANMQPVLLENADDAAKWSRGELPGFLHLYGVFRDPGTVKLDCDFYGNVTHPVHHTVKTLKDLFQARHSIVLGFNSPSDDPLQSKFLETFVENEGQQHTFVVDHAASSFGLPLTLSSTVLQNKISITTESSWSLCKCLSIPPLF